MKEYIEREAVLKCVEEDGRDGEYDLGFWRDNKGFQELIKDIPAADVVPWEWLERYAQGMRMNYASEWVMEAKKRYEEGIH